MDWFKEHSYLAPWLAPLVTVTVALIQNKGNLSKVNWLNFTLYALLFSSFGVVLSSSFDDRARNAANFMMMFSFGALLMSSRTDGPSKHSVDEVAPKSENPTKPSA